MPFMEGHYLPQDRNIPRGIRTEWVASIDGEPCKLERGEIISIRTTTNPLLWGTQSTGVFQRSRATAWEILLAAASSYCELLEALIEAGRC
jgi:hypothetical protein